MPWNKERTAAFYEKEILKYVRGNEPRRNALLDATLVALNGDGRRIIEAGTVMVYTAGVGSKVKPAAASGVLAADVAGILTRTWELWPGTDTTDSDQPVALFFEDATFNAAALVNYSGNIAAVKAGLPRCSFEN